MDTSTNRELSRPTATDGDTDYTLSLDEVSQLYANAGHPRTLRTLQRYCASGHLEAQKVATTLGDKYLLTPQSVARHIAQIAELSSLDSGAAGRDVSRRAATSVIAQPSAPPAQPVATTGSDEPRRVATEQGSDARYVRQLETRIEEKAAVIDLLRSELAQRNEEIVRRNERERETNVLIRGLQNLVLQLQPGRTRTADVLDNDPLATGREVGGSVDNSTTG